MPYIAPVPEHYAPLLPLETRLLGALRAVAGHARQNIVIAATPGGFARIRARFLGWLLLEAIPKSRLPITQLQLEQAAIEGVLDLRGSRLTLRAGFRSCRFDAPIDLTEATVPGFELIAGSVPAIHAERLTVSGSLLVRADAAAPQGHAPITVAGAIRLNGATIHGNFDMEGAILGAEQATERGCLPPCGTPPTYRPQDGSGPRERIVAQERISARGGGTEAGVGHSAWVSLEADGLTVDGHLRCVWPFRATGELRLDGCRIGRNLDCAGATLRNYGGYTLSAAGARIAGTLYLGSPFHERRAGDNPQFLSEGVTRIDGAHIDGDLDCSDGLFRATAFLPDWQQDTALDTDAYALKANGIGVGANVRLANRFAADGNVTFLNATIGRDLYCTGAHFNFAGGEALCCDGVSVAGVVFLDGQPGRPFWTNGLLRFVLADVKQGFYVRDAMFDRSRPSHPLLDHDLFEKFRAPEELGFRIGKTVVSRACGIYADDATIADRFIWKRVSRAPELIRGNYPFWLRVSGSRADIVDDDVKSWTRLDRFDITNCFYRSIAGLFDEGYRLDENTGITQPLNDYIDARLELLDREYAPHSVGAAVPRRDYDQRSKEEAINRFKPQPYLQFARVLRAAGLDGEADDVIVRLERNRTRYGGFTPLRRAGRRFFDLLLKYGYGRSRPLKALAAWSLVSAVAFHAAFLHHHIQPTWHNRQDLTRPADTANALVAFNALVFSLDTLIPLVDLNQKDNWEAEPLSTPLPDRPDSHVPWPVPWYDLMTYLTLLAAAPDRVAALLIMFNKVIGWVLTTAFAGGVTGVLRGGKEAAEIPGAE